jgi:hypothetical protein
MRRHLAAARGRWSALTLYDRFEHAVILAVTGLIAVVVVAAVWTLMVKVVLSLAIIPDLKATEGAQLFALAAAILALGAVHWLVRDQDRRDPVPH